MLPSAQNNAKVLTIFRQSGEILPNLATLLLLYELFVGVAAFSNVLAAPAAASVRVDVVAIVSIRDNTP